MTTPKHNQKVEVETVEQTIQVKHGTHTDLPFHTRAYIFCFSFGSLGLDLGVDFCVGGQQHVLQGSHHSVVSSRSCRRSCCCGECSRGGVDDSIGCSCCDSSCYFCENQFPFFLVCRSCHYGMVMVSVNASFSLLFTIIGTQKEGDR